jgi:hypothetical protein
MQSESRPPSRADIEETEKKTDESLRRVRPPVRARFERSSFDVLPLSEAAQRRMMQARRTAGF